jgi:hypothetical protein
MAFFTMEYMHIPTALRGKEFSILDKNQSTKLRGGIGSR